MRTFDKWLYKNWHLILEHDKLDDLFQLYADGSEDVVWDKWLQDFITSLETEDIGYITEDYRKDNKYWYWKSNVLTIYEKQRSLMLYDYPFDNYALNVIYSKYPVATTKMEAYLILNCFWKSYIYVPLNVIQLEDKMKEIRSNLNDFCINLKTPYTTEELVEKALSSYFSSMLDFKLKYKITNLTIDDYVMQEDITE